MMNNTVNDILRKKVSAQNHPTTSDSFALTPIKNPPGTCFSAKESLPDLSSCPVNVGEKRKRNDEFNDNGDAERGEETIQPENHEGFVLKFNDFDKLRKDTNFVVGQAWALYDNVVDGMPRQYALIRKVTGPGFGVRITYLEPDPDDEKEIQWFEEDLPVSAGKFRLGQNQNRKDRLRFSHLIHCSEGIKSGYFAVSPRKGETWALFKNWDIKWSLEPDSHRKYEYEFVEVLSDYNDEAGVFVSYLHKAKGFASVFFRMGYEEADIFRILPRSLYRFSHKVPSLKLAGTEGVPKDAYELDQAALPETIQEVIAPSIYESNIKSKPQAVYFASKGNVFQTGQIWSFYSGYDDMPLYYGKIQKITYTQTFKQEPILKLHISRLKTTPFPKDVIAWEDRTMPVGCGTYYARNVQETITSNKVSHQVTPQISMDGKEYTILPKTGEVWVIYRSWSSSIDVEDLEYGSYAIVEVLDDSLDYKVLHLEKEYYRDDDDDDKSDYRYLKAAKEYIDDEDDDEEDGSEPIFTIPRSKRLRFSHKVPASRVTKEIYGELKDVLKVDARALPFFLKYPDY